MRRAPHKLRPFVHRRHDGVGLGAVVEVQYRAGEIKFAIRQGVRARKQQNVRRERLLAHHGGQKDHGEKAQGGEDENLAPETRAACCVEREPRPRAGQKPCDGQEREKLHEGLHPQFPEQR